MGGGAAASGATGTVQLHGLQFLSTIEPGMIGLHRRRCNPDAGPSTKTQTQTHIRSKLHRDARLNGSSRKRLWLIAGLVPGLMAGRVPPSHVDHVAVWWALTLARNVVPEAVLFVLLFIRVPFPNGSWSRPDGRELWTPFELLKDHPIFRNRVCLGQETQALAGAAIAKAHTRITLQPAIHAATSR